jgi:hypothetical protein
MPLTDTAIRKAKPEAKQRKLSVERGLFLLISPKGGKWWRFKYQFDGKEKLLSLGTYPDTSLKDARERRVQAAEWRYTVTKTDTQHIVPLSHQAVEILKELQPLTGRGQYVFPGARSAARPMSDNAILAAMRRMGIKKEEMSGHGFRAMARTILDEVLGFRPDYIEHQLAHAVRDPNGRAYNRTAHLLERHKMMQEWADYLDKLKAGADIIPISQSA